MSNVKAVCCRIKADVEGSLSVVYKLFDFFFVCYLRNKAAGN